MSLAAPAPRKTSATLWAAASLASLASLASMASACMPAPGTSNTPEGGAPMPSSIVEPYLRIETALAGDSMDGVTMNAGTIATAAAPFGAPAFKIGTSAAQLTSAVELADAREKFGRLSDTIITYMDGLHLTPPEGVYIASCGGAGQQWLQEGESISNPYDRSSTCGAFR
jgi:hypothetical protein